MRSVAEAYAELIDEALSRAADASLDVGALSEHEQRSLAARYGLDEQVRAMLFERYPRAGIRLPYCDGVPTSYEGSMVLPSLDWLTTRRDNDAKWPRDWFPVSVTGDHYIQFLIAGMDGVFALYDDDFGGDTPYESGNRLYASFEAFLRAAVATLRLVRPEAFISVTEGRWPFRRNVSRLRAEVIAEVHAQSCRPEDGPVLLPQTGIDVA